MIRNAKTNEVVLTQDNRTVTIKRVLRIGKRVTIFVLPDKQWYTAWQLRRNYADRIQRPVLRPKE